jgi:hypothetical protein
MRNRKAAETKKDCRSGVDIALLPRAPFRCWPARCLRCFPISMNTVNHVHVSETAARRVGSTKARRGRHSNGPRDENIVQEPAAAETVAVERAADETATRKRSLLLATLRVWELRHGISE